VREAANAYAAKQQARDEQSKQKESAA
jgi:hypothetical protein